LSYYDEALPIGEQRARRGRRLLGGDRAAALTLGAGFLAAATVLVFVVPSERSASPLLLAGLVAAYMLAYRLDFEVGTGSGVPTQLVLVPMLFLAPLGLVPLLVALAITSSNAIDSVRAAIHPERAALRLLDAWHTVGPVLVLGLAGEAAPSLADWPLYVGALGAQFVFDFASAAARQRLGLGVSFGTQLRAMSSVWLVDASLAPAGLAVALAASGTPSGVVLALPLMALLAVFARERRVRIDHALELSRAYRGTVFLLGDVIEADDAYTGSHSRDVVALTLAVAEDLGLDESERRQAEFTALLHDVGKVRTPSEIISKPGPLTDEERAVMELHTIHGQRMLEQVGGILGDVGRLVRSCHERWDGDGYPDGLAGEHIPLISRIVTCCDAFNAMTTDRPYRKALPLGEAFQELRRGSGSQFDPAVVEALVRVIADGGLLSSASRRGVEQSGSSPGS
jgi:HD-GYP domain-containing protein (c-di-GMP phosphodiesterase class II)